MTVLLMLRSAAKDNLRSSDMGISGLNHTPRAAAVYASRPPLLSDSRNTRFQAARYALPGLDFHQLIAPASWRTLCPPLYETSQEETQKTRQSISASPWSVSLFDHGAVFFAPTALGVERRAQPRSRLAVTVLKPRAYRGQAMP
jgi:hypothetical protein